MADSAVEGRTYRIKDGTFSLNVHYNGKRVVAEESYNSPSAKIAVRCECCGDTTHVSVADLE